MSLLRIQIEQAKRSKTVRQLIDSARIRMDEDEFPLALQKVQSVLEMDPETSTLWRSRARSSGSAARVRSKTGSVSLNSTLKINSSASSCSAVEEILEVDASNTQARAFLSEVDRKEEEASKIREEKQKLYEAALVSHKNGAITDRA